MSLTITHGTRACYELGCGCPPCREANAEYKREWRRSKQGQQPTKHGVYAHRVYGCRCDICVEEFRTKWRAMAQRRRARNKQQREVQQ